MTLIELQEPPRTVSKMLPRRRSPPRLPKGTRDHVAATSRSRRAYHRRYLKPRRLRSRGAPPRRPSPHIRLKTPPPPWPRRPRLAGQAHHNVPRRTSPIMPIVPRLLDCSIARLLDCSIARLPDCPIARLPDCPIARLPDCPIARSKREIGRTYQLKQSVNGLPP
jgi:hypothetical protein